MILLWAFTKLGAVESLPEGQLDAWIETIKTLHTRTPLLARDQARERRLRPPSTLF